MRHDEILGLLPDLKFGLDHSPGLWLFCLELFFWIAVFSLTWALIRWQPAVLDRVELKLRQLGQHTRFWLLTFPLAVIVIRSALLPWVPAPVPTFHDEFSYLLASDTFAHGRLTNPPHPMWVHFESFHINVLPTYQSMYPPAQGLALALGQKLTGMPWAGVVLSTAVMCSAIYWMLLGWLPAPWAWLGGAFVVARYGIFSYWINSYWGGSVAALGGALVLGALPRLRRQVTASPAIIFALGLLILATSRPLEGFLFSLPLLLVAALRIIRCQDLNWRTRAKRCFPALAFLAAGFAWMLYYNWRGTGNPLQMPYVVNYRTYHISKPYIFQKTNPVPNYRHQAMRTFYVYHELTDVLRLKYEGLGYVLRQKAAVYYACILWPFLLLVAPGLYTACRGQLRVVLFSVALLALELFAQVWPPHAHYAAPAAGAMILLVLYCLRHFRSSHSVYGIWASRAAILGMAVWMLSPIAECILNPFGITALTIREEMDPERDAYRMFEWMPQQIRRQQIVADLARRGGKHLVIVHHPYHDIPAVDWIYNNADIDHAPIIWARDMGYLKNKELLAYYADRQVWYVDRADLKPGILPYEQAMEPWRLAFEPIRFDGRPKPEAAHNRPPFGLSHGGHHRAAVRPIESGTASAVNRSL